MSVLVWGHHGSGWRSVLTGYILWVRSVRLSLDENRIVSESRDRSVRVWEHDGRRWHSEVLTGHADRVSNVNISSDGRRIVSESDDVCMQVWVSGLDGEWHCAKVSFGLSCSESNICRNGPRVVI